jgi:hypothetical protein
MGTSTFVRTERPVGLGARPANTASPIPKYGSPADDARPGRP